MRPLVSLSLPCSTLKPTLVVANTSEPYFRDMTPGSYTHVNRDQRYSTSQDFAPAPSLIPGVYQQMQQYPSQCLPMSNQSGLHLDNTAQQTRFIPTPSQIAHAYSTYPQQTAAHTIQDDLYDPSSFDYPAAANQMAFPSNDMHPQPSRIITTGRPRGGSAANSTSPTSSTSPSGERFPCEKCGKTFSRSHDRKRHYETQHLPSPIVHRCVYCRKEFSRYGILINS